MYFLFFFCCKFTCARLDSVSSSFTSASFCSPSDCYYFHWSFLCFPFLLSLLCLSFFPSISCYVAFNINITIISCLSSINRPIIWIILILQQHCTTYNTVSSTSFTKENSSERNRSGWLNWFYFYLKNNLNIFVIKLIWQRFYKCRFEVVIIDWWL